MAITSVRSTVKNQAHWLKSTCWLPKKAEGSAITGNVEGHVSDLRRFSVLSRPLAGPHGLMRLQDRPEGSVLMNTCRTGGGRLGFFLLRRRAVGILCGRCGGGRRLLLGILLRGAGRRRYVVDDDDVPGRHRLRFNGRRHLTSETQVARWSLSAGCVAASGPDGIRMGFDGFGITGGQSRQIVGRLLGSRRNEGVL
jgi:hypothetical protein